MTELKSRDDIHIIFASILILLLVMQIAMILFTPVGTGTEKTLVTMVGENDYDYFGWNVSGAGDVNWDGYDDVIVGAPGYGSAKGRAYIFFGGPWFTGDLIADNADVIIEGNTIGDGFGWDVSCAGDMNNDTFYDVVIGAPGTNIKSGAAYVFFGNDSMPLLMDALKANVTISGSSIGDEFGTSVSGAMDLNNDNFDDVIIGAPGNDSNTGVAHIFLGAQILSDNYNAKYANVSMFGENFDDKFGFSVSNAGDVNNDDFDDVIIGAPGADKAYIFYGSQNMNAWVQSTEDDFNTAYEKVHLDITGGIDGEVRLRDFFDIKATMAYYDNSFPETPIERTWNQIDWSPEKNAIQSAGEKYWFVMEPGTVRKNEKILAVSDIDLDINVQISDGIVWDNELEITGALKDAKYRSFDVAYESISGEAMIAYFNQSSGSKIPKSRIWNGFTWGPEEVAEDVGGVDIHWIELASNPNSNEILMVTLNMNGELYAQVWNDSVWGDSMLLESSVAVTDSQCFDVVYESQSGNGMIAWANDTIFDNLRYIKWKGGWTEPEGTWGTAEGIVHFVKLASDPKSDYILAAELNDLPGINATVWDGIIWGSHERLTTNPSVTNQRCFDVAWESKSDKEGLVVYGESNEAPLFRRINYTQINNTPEPSLDANPNGPGLPNWIRLKNDPQSKEIMMIYIVNDGPGAQDDIGVELWTGEDWESPRNVTEISNRDDAQRFDLTYTDTSGYLLSEPLDVGRPASWGRIMWADDIPPGSTVKFSTRTSA
ncbi:MAG: FG-GAP repeat protein, partial [Thermoplasmata archaeon]